MAEIGGYMGIFVGVSLLDFARIVGRLGALLQWLGKNLYILPIAVGKVFQYSGQWASLPISGEESNLVFFSSLVGKAAERMAKHNCGGGGGGGRGGGGRGGGGRRDGGGGGGGGGRCRGRLNVQRLFRQGYKFFCIVLFLERSTVCVRRILEPPTVSRYYLYRDVGFILESTIFLYGPKKKVL